MPTNYSQIQLETTQNLPHICPTLDFKLYLCQAFCKHFPHILSHQACMAGGTTVIPILQVSLLVLRLYVKEVPAVGLEPGLSGSEFLS